MAFNSGDLGQVCIEQDSVPEAQPGGFRAMGAAIRSARRKDGDVSSDIGSEGGGPLRACKMLAEICEGQDESPPCKEPARP